ncbi:MAG: hypothetical protein P4L40_21235 [Terracidiphilus sp.]|nr:hypothetical protein [Terracidiphilus sp.]
MCGDLFFCICVCVCVCVCVCIGMGGCMCVYIFICVFVYVCVSCPPQERVAELVEARAGTHTSQSVSLMPLDIPDTHTHASGPPLPGIVSPQPSFIDESSDLGIQSFLELPDIAEKEAVVQATPALAPGVCVCVCVGK